MQHVLKKLMQAQRCAYQGLVYVTRHEWAFRIELLLTIFVVPLACWLGESGLQRALLIASWLLIPIVELINTSIEATVDRIGPEQHELSGRAKDLGASAVWLACLNALVVWLFIIFK